MSELKRISHEKLEDILHERSIWFYHKKCNGNIKKTLATLCETKMPNRVLPIPSHNGCTIYYDILIGQYRSCSKKLEIWIDPKEIF